MNVLKIALISNKQGLGLFTSLVQLPSTVFQSVPVKIVTYGLLASHHLLRNRDSLFEKGIVSSIMAFHLFFVLSNFSEAETLSKGHLLRMEVLFDELPISSEQYLMNLTVFMTTLERKGDLFLLDTLRVLHVRKIR